MDSDLVERVRRAIYDAFASEAHAPSLEQIQALVGTDETDVAQAIKQLAADRHLALDIARNIVMAHPFCSMNLGFSVMGDKNCGGEAAHGTASRSRISSPTSLAFWLPQPARM